jgi:hypothetical protein
MFKKATHEGSRQTKRAGTSPSMMRVNTVAMCRSSLPEPGSPWGRLRRVFLLTHNGVSAGGERHDLLVLFLYHLGLTTVTLLPPFRTRAVEAMMPGFAGAM